MTTRHQPDLLVARDEIVAPPSPLACDDQSFELPASIFAAMAGLLFAYLAIMAIGFASPTLAIPMAINFIFLTAFFALPTIFVAASPTSGSRALQWTQFLEKGVTTGSGHTSGKEAVVLTLLLPFLILCWGIAVIAIAAAV